MMLNLRFFSFFIIGAGAHDPSKVQKIFAKNIHQNGQNEVLEMYLAQRRVKEAKSKNVKIVKDYPEQWYEQTLDHFDESDTRTWSQRFFVNDEHYEKGGPIFLMIGGEGEINSRYVDGSFLNVEMAKQLKGAAIGVEHRFYGKSQPFNDKMGVEELKYLTSQQALADLNQFSHWINKKRYGNQSKFFCMGGSYPGNLAAWYKEKYNDDDTLVGCFSFSAPIYPKVDFFEYGHMVYEAMSSTQYGEAAVSKLLDGYRTIADELKFGTLKTKNAVLSSLKACPYSVATEADMANVESFISGQLAGVVQYNNTRAEGTNIEDYAKIIAEAPSATDAAWKILELVTYDENLRNPSDGPMLKSGECADLSLRATYESLTPETWGEFDYGKAAGRCWTWQTCNEMGYFQTSRISSSSPTMYTTGVSDPSQWTGMCENVFSKGEVGESVEKTLEYYNQKEVDNLIYINGEFDPWSTLSNKDYKEGKSYLIKNGSHCVGLYGNPETTREILPSAADVQEKLIGYAVDWWKKANDGKGEVVDEDHVPVVFV